MGLKTYPNWDPLTEYFPKTPTPEDGQDSPTALHECKLLSSSLTQIDKKEYNN